jgi:hypothetical protein
MCIFDQVVSAYAHTKVCTPTSLKPSLATSPPLADREVPHHSNTTPAHLWNPLTTHFSCLPHPLSLQTRRPSSSRLQYHSVSPATFHAGAGRGSSCMAIARDCYALDKARAEFGSGSGKRGMHGRRCSTVVEGDMHVMNHGLRGVTTAW